MASFIPSQKAEKPKENSPKKSPKKSCKEQRQLSKIKKKAAKYLVDDNSIIALDNVLQEEGIVIKKEENEEQNDKYLDLGNISLHFNDEENEGNTENVLVEKKENEEVDMMMSLYPKPRMAKAIDFRSEICNGSFYH